MPTYVATPKTIDSKWHVIDADGQVLGRVATLAARLLQGKHKPTYTPFIDTGDFVVIVNAASVKLTGRKENQKIYRRHSGYEGGLREERAVDIRVTVAGGGVNSQSGAVRLGIARALVRFNAELRKQLKKDGLLTSDSRVKERKKYGMAGARKRFQFSKR